MLGLVTCHFNPHGYKRLLSNYWRFREKLRHPLVTVEVAFDDQEFQIEDSIKIRGTRDKHYLWQKERLLNIGFESLPSQCDQLAWIDADLIFLNDNWFEETQKQLEQYPVVQLFDGVIDMKPDNTFAIRETAWAGVNHRRETGNHTRRPGGAWAMRRDVIADGLYEQSIIGSGDAFQLIAWTGDWQSWLLKQTPPKARKEFLLWAWDHYERVKGNIGYVSGDVLHLYHGSRQNRLYCERNQWLVDADFQNADVRIDDNGLLAWATDKQQLHQQVKEYFGLRREDE